jgi:hypothetical protein
VNSGFKPVARGHRWTAAQLAQWVASGPGATVTTNSDGVTTVTPGRLRPLPPLPRHDTHARAYTGPASTATHATAPETRPREAGSRRRTATTAGGKDPPEPGEDDEPPSGRGAPALLVELALEAETPTVRLLAETHEDERRLAAWVIRSRAVRDLAATILAALDAHEREEATP